MVPKNIPKNMERNVAVIANSAVAGKNFAIASVVGNFAV